MKSSSAPSSPPSPRAVLLVVCAALAMVVVDVTVLHVAAPAITASLEPSAVELLWIVDIYPLVVAPLLLVVGVSGDRFGRKKMLVMGLAIFGMASLPAAFATSALILILSRAIMGVGAAMIMPSTMSLLRAAYPDRGQRMRAVGIWSAVSALGAAIGPLIGGLLVQQFWWGAVFLINVPFALIVLLLAWKLIPESKSRTPAPIDPFSVLLSIGSVLSLVYAIKELARYGPDPISVLMLGVAATGITLFTWRQLGRLRHGIPPLLNVRLFARAPFTFAVLAVLLSMMGIVGLDLIFAQYLQSVLGFAPVDAALRLLPMAAATVAGSLSAATIVHRFGTRVAISVGLGASTAALVPLLTLGVAEQLLLFSVCLAVLGFWLDVALVAANDTIISAVPEDNVGQASGVEETAYDLGGGLGIAILGSILATSYTLNFPAIPGLSDAELTAASESIGGAERTAAENSTGLSDQILAGADNAFIAGLHTALLTSIIVIGVTAIGSAIFLKNPAKETAID